MVTDNLRNFSWRMFIITLVCGLTGILVIISIPNPGYRNFSDLAVHLLATSGFGLVGIAMIANIVSLVSGMIAWIKGTQHCWWVFISAFIFLVPLTMYIALLLY